MNRLIRSLLFLLTLITAFNARSQNNCFPEKDNNRLVYDEVGLLESGEAQALEVKLSEFAKKTSNQIVVVIVPDLCGMDRAEFATELGHAWGVGQAKFDNGVVVLVKPTGGKGERHLYIAVGSGLEGAIPDLAAGRVVDYEILPAFRKEEYYNGLNRGTDVIMELAAGEYSFEVYEQKKRKSQWIGALIILAVFLIIIVAIAASAKRYAHVNNLDYWTAFWLMANSGRSHRGTWGGGSGFGGGGGFGGFGGGGFGGGGAGGSW